MKAFFVYTLTTLVVLLLCQVVYYMTVVKPVTRSMATGRKTKPWERNVQASGLYVQFGSVLCIALIVLALAAMKAAVFFRLAEKLL